MTTKKNQKKTENRGGSRPGAGRPKKNRVPTDSQKFDSAQGYLEAVVQGSIESDPVRVRAACSLLRYQEAPKRTPKAAKTPRQLKTTEILAAEKSNIEDFEAKAAEIRKKHAKKYGTDQ